MDDKNKGEDLYAELKRTLADVKESGEEEAPVATDLKPTTEDKPVEKEVIVDESGELTEEEISKLHPKAQKRIKELADKVKELADKPADKTPETTPKEDEPDTQEFKNVNDFLKAVEDEPSRNLLEKFYKVMKNETSDILSPLEKANNEAKFEQEFSKYEKIEGLADYKNDLRKTFLRNPNQSFKALVGEIVTDLTLNKVKPIETTPSTPKRDGKIDTDGKTKDELYDMLDSMRN